MDNIENGNTTSEPTVQDEMDRYVSLMTSWTAAGAYSETEMFVRLRDVIESGHTDTSTLLSLVESKRANLQQIQYRRH
jgi:hypothetical protein